MAISLLFVEYVSAIVFLITVGILLLRAWQKHSVESFFYWGFGLCLWGAALALEALIKLSYLPETRTLFFIRFHIEGLAFVFFLLYGTLILVIPKKQANLLAGLYYVIFFVAIIIIGGSTNGQLSFSLWHNILFITPPAMIFAVYYHFYYKREKKKSVLFLSNVWMLFAVLAYFYTFTFGTNILPSSFYTLWHEVQKGVIVLLALTYMYFLAKENEIWSLVYKPEPIVVEENLKEFFAKFFYDRAEPIIREEMEKVGAKQILISSKLKREQFIDICIKDYFSNVASLQKQEVIRTELMSLLNLSWDSSRFANHEYSNAKM